MAVGRTRLFSHVGVERAALAVVVAPQTVDKVAHCTAKPGLSYDQKVYRLASELVARGAFSDASHASVFDRPRNKPERELTAHSCSRHVT